MAWHELPTNYTDPLTGGNTTVTGIGSLFQYLNGVVDQKLGIVILIMSFVVSFLALKGSSSDKAFAASSFFTLIVAILLWRIVLIPFEYLLFVIIMTVVGILLVRSEREKLGL